MMRKRKNKQINNKMKQIKSKASFKMSKTRIIMNYELMMKSSKRSEKVRFYKKQYRVDFFDLFIFELTKNLLQIIF